jgi:O-antigen ligase
VFAFGALLLAGLTVVSPDVRQRVERTAQVASASAAGVDDALSGRARIWSAAWCIVKAHPVNGVGPRGFREAFPACDPQPERIAEWGLGPAHHAHQIVLEILSETGAIGLLLWLAGAAMARRAWRYAEAGAREAAWPAMLALVVTVFPFNTHLAFYSTFWGGVTLLLAALYAGSLLGRDTTAAAPAAQS